MKTVQEKKSNSFELVAEDNKHVNLKLSANFPARLCENFLLHQRNFKLTFLLRLVLFRPDN